ncbi:MAG: presequence protease, mitochondrial, partial [Chlamydiota bacterium]
MLHSALSFEGGTHGSFLVTRYLPLDELHASLIELVHVPTGASVMHIACDDPENLFCLSFQTLPPSSNGVAHVLEHTVLCGSKKFPVKDPFFSMTRRSLHTYMNALTGQDFTCYPASSQIEKDFYNLLEVYLDSVFHPLLKEISFLQEGHRLELADVAHPKTSPLVHQGVVFNEMKGAMSQLDSRLWEALAAALTPDLPYAHNSGGNPKEIATLTHRDLLEFHATFYHPSRCLFFFYGNLNLVKHLDFIEQHALAGVGKMAPLPPLPRQRRFTQPVTAEAKYPVAEAETKGVISIAWLTAPVAHQEEVLALCLIDSLLMDTDASPLKRALLTSKLCTEAESSLDVEMSEVPYTLTCKGCDCDQANALVAKVLSALAECVRKRFTHEDIEASLHQLEFQRTEIGAEGIPFGLSLFFRAAIIKQHGCDAKQALLIHSLFDDLRAKCKDPQFLTGLIQRHLIDNAHRVTLVLRPDRGLDAAEQAAEEKGLEKIARKVDPAKIKDQMEHLMAAQATMEKQSLACLPKVTLKDVPRKTRVIELKRDKNVFVSPQFTNKIVYADFVIGLPEIAATDLPLLSMMTHFFTEMGCKGRTFEEMLSYQQAYTGGLNASLALHVTQNADVCCPTFGVHGKALERNSDRLIELLKEMTDGVDWSDQARLGELVAEEKTQLQNRLAKNGLSYAIQSALSGLGMAGYVYNQWNGLPYYQRVMQWAKNPETLPEALMRLQKTVLESAPEYVVTCEADVASDLVPKIGVSTTQSKDHWQGAYRYHPVASHVAFIPAPVAFTAYGMRTVGYQHKDAPFLWIAAELLKNGYLHPEIREKGGAYGGGATYAPTTGNFHFYAYRDPKLARTLTVFQGAATWLAEGRFSEEQLEEAKLSSIQTLDAPIPPSNRAMVAYSWQRAHRTVELRQAFRDHILSASKSDITAAATHLMQPAVTVSLLGKEL